MKTIVLYGPGEVSKRAALSKIKKEYSQDSIISIDLKVKDLADLDVALASTSLFETGKRLIVAENASETLSLKSLKFTDQNLTLVIVAGSLKAASILLSDAKSLQAKTYLFEGEKEVSAFPFLDALIEGKKSAYVELDKLLKEYGGMYVYSMIYYLLRRNILPLPQSDFAKKKILEQKQKYSTEDFIKLYQLTLESEFSIKKGIMPETLNLTQLVSDFIAKQETSFRRLIA